MTVILDPELKALMGTDESVAVLWQDANNERTALLAKAPDEDVASFKGKVPIRTYWELGRFACGSAGCRALLERTRSDTFCQARV